MAKKTNGAKKPAVEKGRKGFQPGVSGNPEGDQSSRNKVTREPQALLDARAPELMAKAIELALEGNMQALKLCIERILPPVKIARWRSRSQSSWKRAVT